MRVRDKCHVLNHLILLVTKLRLCRAHNTQTYDVHHSASAYCLLQHLPTTHSQLMTCLRCPPYPLDKCGSKRCSNNSKHSAQADAQTTGRARYAGCRAITTKKGCLLKADQVETEARHNDDRPPEQQTSRLAPWLAFAGAEHGDDIDLRVMSQPIGMRDMSRITPDAVEAINTNVRHRHNIRRGSMAAPIPVC